MSLVVLANHLASRGRGEDSMLVHMTPKEVAGLQSLALAHGGSLTINPDTGLPEAGFLSSILPMIAGMALNFIAPGVGTVIGEALGTSAAVGTGIAVGGITGLATGSLQKGLMAGIGAYGGASLGAGLAGAGETGYLAQGASAAAQAGEAASQGAYLGGETSAEALEAARQNAVAKSLADRAREYAGLSPFEKMGQGFNGLKDNKGLMTLAKPAFAAFAPTLAGQGVKAGLPATVTKPPTAYITPYRFDPATQTYTSLGRYRPEDFPGFENLQPQGKASGGIVALADGGPAPSGDAALDQFNSFIQSGDYNAAGQLAASYGYTPDQVSSYLNANYGSNLTAENVSPFMTGGGGSAATSAGAATPAGAAGPAAPMSAPAPSAYDAWQAKYGSSTNPLVRGLYNISVGEENLANRTDLTATDRQHYENLATIFNSGGSNAERAAAMAQYLSNNGLDTNYVSHISTIPVDQVNAFIYSGIGAPSGTAYGVGTVQPAAVGTPGQYTPDQYKAAGQWIAANINNPALVASRGAALGLTIDDFLKAAQTVNPNLTRDNVVRYFADNGIIYGDAQTSKPAVTPKPISAPASSKKPPRAPKPGRTPAPAPAPAPAPYSGPGVAPAPTPSEQRQNAEEIEKVFSTMTGGSKAAYDYLMGRGPNPVSPSTGGGPIAKPYWQALGAAAPVYKSIDLPPATSPGGSTAAPPPPPVTTGVGASLTAADKAVFGQALTTGRTSGDYSSLQALIDRYQLSEGDVYAGWPGVTKEDVAALKNLGVTFYVPPAPTYEGGGGGAKRGGLLALAAGGSGVANRLSSLRIADLQSLYEKATKENDVPAMRAYKGELDLRQRLSSYAPYGGGEQPEDVQPYNLGGYSDGGRLLKGPGDGVSDSIPATIGDRQPARLADGEFVVPARIVSELGNGSTEAGARKLYAMMDRVQKARNKTTGRGKVAEDTRADQYLPA